MKLWLQRVLGISDLITKNQELMSELVSTKREVLHLEKKTITLEARVNRLRAELLRGVKL